MAWFGNFSSSMRRARTWMTPSTFCSGPSICSRAAVWISERYWRKTGGITAALLVPVSSSSVMKHIPFAVPGRWRTITRPAIFAHWPLRACLRSALFRTPRCCNSSRRYFTMCGPTVMPLAR